MSLSPGGPASMDSLLAGDITLMDRDQDLSLLPVPLLPLPNDFGLIPDTAWGRDLSQLMARHNWNHVRLFLSTS